MRRWCSESFAGMERAWANLSCRTYRNPRGKLITASFISEWSGVFFNCWLTLFSLTFLFQSQRAKIPRGVVSFRDGIRELWWNPVPFHVDLQDCCSPTLLSHTMLQSAVCSVLMTCGSAAQSVQSHLVRSCPDTSLHCNKVKKQFREMRNPCWNSLWLSVKCHLSTGFPCTQFLISIFLCDTHTKRLDPKSFL